MGSKFSKHATATELLYASLTTSNSISFQWWRYFSTSTLPTALCAKALTTHFSSSLLFHAMKLPLPPKVNAILTITGYPNLSAISNASSTLLAASLGGIGIPFSFIVLANRVLSVAFFIPSMGVPITFTPYFCKTPLSQSSTPNVRAVCPPKPMSMPSGLSASIIFSSMSLLSGTKYNLSLISLVV